MEIFSIEFLIPSPLQYYKNLAIYDNGHLKHSPLKHQDFLGVELGQHLYALFDISTYEKH